MLSPQTMSNKSTNAHAGLLQWHTCQYVCFCIFRPPISCLRCAHLLDTGYITFMVCMIQPTSTYLVVYVTYNGICVVAANDEQQINKCTCWITAVAHIPACLLHHLPSTDRLSAMCTFVRHRLHNIHGWHDPAHHIPCLCHVKFLPSIVASHQLRCGSFGNRDAALR